jgi:NAD(P)-dependent dehydrogenase (short-subunit alcohol dehydrogenase family)
MKHRPVDSRPAPVTRRGLFNRRRAGAGPRPLCHGARAAQQRRGDFLALTDDEWADGFALKFFAHVRLLRAAWPALVAARRSALIISGAGGRTHGPEFAIGGSVNAALLSLTKALAARGDGVQVNAVNPGAIRTERLGGRIKALAAKENLDEAAAAGQMISSLASPASETPERSPPSSLSWSAPAAATCTAR